MASNFFVEKFVHFYIGIFYGIFIKNGTSGPVDQKLEWEERMEEMTKEEMQRFLNREAEQGNTEYETLKALVDILGISFPKLGSDIRGRV